nr:immunoglobulin light chain junction region [Macaca mulatta]MPO04593.1 immunoglobulin light chain junction region [Macaca mulatta]MPO05630.1 immunoglobulin light chain junction region [Macaca mulatta]MPO08571.1 immunoglobulin light chain junction region [Macaca mulatta]MPO09565.1 immunoglobulin light chain junction region [Macaca mulatta]
CCSYTTSNTFIF